MCNYRQLSYKHSLKKAEYIDHKSEFVSKLNV